VRRRYDLALALAVLFAVLDFLYYPFLLFYANLQILHYILYGPFFGAAWLLEWVDTVLGSALTKSPWSLALLFLNWLCYASLGFLVGLKLGRHLWKEP
jgi:hypothetical protein